MKSYLPHIVALATLGWLTGCGDSAASIAPSTDTSAATADTLVADTADAGSTPMDAAPMDAEHDTKPTICAEGSLCNDGDFCTKNDRCTAGICAGEPYDCADDLECTLDVCDGKGGCNASLQAGNWCLILGSCIADGAQHPDNPCLACVTPISSLDWSANDGGSCNDGLECTADDRCADGLCKGQQSACIDGNPCTTDGCKEGEGCIHAALQGPCEDGNVCTTGDGCTNAQCLPGATTLDCDDANQCTVDTCDPAIGCLHTTEDIPCDDGDPCTTGDICILGDCLAGTVPLSCDDQDPCTNDACVKATGCIHVPNLSSCDDGDPCTVGDTCSAGTCLSGVLDADCDDENPCTADICTALLGCEHPPILGPCDDGDSCTTDDACQSGQCIGGAIADCDDGDICTDDGCNTSAGGCEYVNNNAPCDDGDPCTLLDACADGDCSSVFAGCDDNNPCTFDQCVGNAECVHEPLSTEGCLVSITLTSPTRAAELTGLGWVLVKGNVQSPAGAIETLEVNGEELPVAENGDFGTLVVADHGVNVVEVIAVDTLGNTDVAVRSFYFGASFRPMSSTNPTASKMAKALYFTLGPQAIDDGVHNPNEIDDLATLLELLISSFDVAELLPNPVINNSDYKVNVYNTTYSTPTAQLTPVPQGINLWARILDFKTDVSANGKCFFCPNASGVIRIDEIRIQSTVNITTQNGQTNATLNDTQVLLFGLDVDINGILGSIFDFLVDFIVGGFSDSIENAFESELGAAIPDLLEEAIGSLSLSTTFEIPPLVPGANGVDLQLTTGLETTVFNDDGGLIRMWGAATTPKAVNATSKGTLLRSACLSGGTESLNLLGEQPLQAGVMDDLLNQILFTMWWGGGLEFSVPPSLLGDADLSAFGIDNVSLDLKCLRPPVVTSCNAANEPVLQIGDIEVSASLDLLGNPVELLIYASTQAPVDIIADGQGLGIAVSDIDFVKTEIVVLTPGFATAEQAVGTLVAEQLTPALLTLIGTDALATFPLPELDLSGLIDGIPEGTTLSINPNTVDRVLGWTIVRGDVQ